MLTLVIPEKFCGPENYTLHKDHNKYYISSTILSIMDNFPFFTYNHAVSCIYLQVL